MAAVERATAGGRPGPSYYLLALSLCFIWGVTFVTIKVAVSGSGPFFVAWARQLLAGLSVALYLRLSFKGVSFLPASWLLLLINGLLYSLTNVGVSLGVNLSTAARGVVIIYTQPLFVAVMAHFMLKGEKLGALKLSGTGLALLGLVLVFSQKLGRGALRGDFIILASAIFWAIQTIYVKRYLSRENPFLVAVWQNLAGFPLVFALGLMMEDPSRLEPGLSVILAIIYCGPIAVGFAVVLWVKLLQDHPASRFSSFLFIAPVFGVLVGHFALGDPLGGGMILGVALVCGGIYLVNRPEEETA